jgi:uncharacterized protein (DUF2126 family)
VHYNAEPARRAEYHSLVAEGMRPGFAVDDGVALHFEGVSLRRVVSSREEGCAYHVERAKGRVIETTLEVSLLGASARASRPVERVIALA